MKGKPKKDGSGKGTQENHNRGGCYDGEVCEISEMIRQQYRGRDK